MSFVAVGKVLAPHGVGGLVRVEPWSAVRGRFARGARVFVGGREHDILASSRSGPALILHLAGIDDREAAEALRGAVLEVPEEDVPPPSRNTYYHYQIIGLPVFTVQGERLGVVSEIIETGANDVYVVSGGPREVLVPAVAGFVVRIDLEARRMVVDLPEGLR